MLRFPFALLLRPTKDGMPTAQQKKQKVSSVCQYIAVYKLSSHECYAGLQLAITFAPCTCIDGDA